MIDIVAVTAITTGLTQVAKMTRGLEKHVEGREKLLSLAIAMVISLLGGLDIMSGIIAGLASQGLYETGVKTLTNGVKNLVG